jgi:hypothetical protein
MASDKATATAEIESYVAKWGGYYSQWYAGIAADARKRLFSDHAVNENGDAWIYRECTTSNVARAVEKHFLDQGMKGGGGGGDETTDCVYAYRIGAHTVE